jgi:hypothetical protein
MAQTVIEELVVSIKADLKKAEEDLEKLKKELADLDKETKQVAKGSWQEFINKLKESAEPLTKKNVLFRQATGFINDTGKAVVNLYKVLMSHPFGIIVTAVGALIGAMTGLIKVFMGTEEGGDRVRRVFAGLNEMWQRFIGVLQETAIGAATVLEGLFSWDYGKIRSGLDRIAEGWKNGSAQMEEAYRRGKQIFDLQEELKQMQIANTTEIAKKQAEYNRLLEEAAQMEKGGERVKLLEKAKAVYDSMISMQRRELEMQLKIAQEKTKSNETDQSAKLEIAKIEAQLIDLDARRSAQTKRLSAEIARTRREEADAIRLNREELERIRREEEEYSRQQEYLAKLEYYQSIQDLIEDIGKRFGKLESEMEPIELMLEEVDEDFNRMAETHYKGMAKMVEQAKIYQHELNMVAGLVSDTLTTAFMQAIQSGQSFAEALVTAFKQIIVQLTAMIAKAMIFRMIVSAFGGGVVGSGLFTAGQAIFSLGGNRGIGSFAEGGIVRGPQLAIVGDNPGREELIIPKERYRDFFGGGMTGINVSIRGNFENRGDRQVIFFERAKQIIRRG